MTVKDEDFHVLNSVKPKVKTNTTRNFYSLSDMYRRAPDTFNNTMGNSRMEI